MPCNWRK